MEEAWKVSLQDRQMSMDLFERRSYLQFTYEYAEESLMAKIKNDTLEKKLPSSYAKLTTAATTLSNEAG